MNLNTEQHFSTVPNVSIPRSKFDGAFSHKTTINANYLVPIFCKDALPGDSFKLDFTVFGRLINPLVCPVIDELYLETLWFKCPNRLLWSNWKKFCGEQDNPEDSTDYIVPVVNSGSSGGFSNMSVFDYFALPTQVENYDAVSLPFRMYNLTYNQWFRDENLVNSVTVPMGDSDDISNYTLLKSAKMHDYFTSCLPFAQKGDPVLLPLGIDAGISTQTNNADVYADSSVNTVISAGNLTAGSFYSVQPQFSQVDYQLVANERYPVSSDFKTNLYADLSDVKVDLSQATAASINDIRFAFQLQKFRERNALSGNRYIEYIKAHFGITSPDARQQRVEFLGSTRTMIDVNTVVQSGGGSTPNGSLTAFGVVGKHGYGFSTSFTEHSYVLGLCRIRHNPIYQQGLNRMWSRKTLIDFYDPVFACIGEQPVLKKELVCQGNDVTEDDGVTIIDDEAFGFQEAWADYRYCPSYITGKLRSNDAQSLDVWHYSQYFATEDSNGDLVPYCPELNQDFIEENIPIERSIAVKDEPQFLLDFHFNLKMARPMPVHSVPGLVDHF